MDIGSLVADELKRQKAKQKDREKFVWTPEREREFRAYPIDTLLFDPYFMGLKKETMYPAVERDIHDLFEERKTKDIRHAIFLQPPGTGKGTRAGIIIWLLVYDLITHLDPQSFFGVMKTSSLTVCVYNRNEEMSRRVTFEKIYPLFGSQFFQDYFPPSVTQEDLKSVRRTPRGIRFPKNIIVFPGSPGAAMGVGHDIVAAVVDEANRLEFIEKSMRARTGERDAAQELHDFLVTQIDSRFGHLEKWPGMIVWLGNPSYPGDFLDRMTADATPDKFIRKGTVWDLFPERTFGKKFFKFDVETMQVIRSAQECLCGERLVELGERGKAWAGLYCPKCKIERRVA